MDEIITGLVITIGGSLINFISTKVYNYVTGKSKDFIWRDKYQELSKLKAPTDFEELKKRTRIVVIDDEDSFPIQLFQNEGYAVDKWDKVKDYCKLENGFYDIIILDIKGIAEHISEDDGIGVLVDLKSKNPAQIIISFSQFGYDLNKVKFFQLADENITKPSDFLKIKKIIDNLILNQFKPERYISALNRLLEEKNIDKKNIRKLNIELSKAIQNKQKPNWAKSLDFITDKADLLKQSISLANTILKFFQ